MGDYYKYLSGGLSGVIEVVFTHPLDFIKTKKQLYNQEKCNLNFYKSLIKEKNLNFYKGITPRIMGIIPMRFVFWGVQDNTNLFLKNYSYNKYTKGIIIGTTGGFFQTLIDSPIEYIKINHMSEQKINYNDILKNNYGFCPTLFRNIGFAICMSTLCLQNKTNNNLYNFTISSLSGFIASFITHPFDFVKTYLQSNKKNINTFKILKHYYNLNPKILYTGCLNRSISSFFSMGIGFVAYNNIYQLISN